MEDTISKFGFLDDSHLIPLANVAIRKKNKTEEEKYESVLARGYFYQLNTDTTISSIICENLDKVFGHYNWLILSRGNLYQITLNELSTTNCYSCNNTIESFFLRDKMCDECLLLSHSYPKNGYMDDL